MIVASREETLDLARGISRAIAIPVIGISIALAAPVSAATKAIRAGRAIDPSGKPIANALIVVDNDRVVSVGTGTPPAGAELIDLSRYTVIPGMIDAHTHMT